MAQAYMLWAMYCKNKICFWKNDEVSTDLFKL
jgi:hypothetical protein